MRPNYIPFILLMLLGLTCGIPLSAQVICGPEPVIDTAGFSGTTFFNYGSSARLTSQQRKMSIAVGQTFIGYLDGLDNNSTLGFYSRYLLPPFAVALSATQGDLLDRIQLSWEIDALGPTPNEGFNIYRDGVFLANVGPNIRTYNDFNVIAGIAYNYEVRGINVYGEGSVARAIGFQVPNGTVTGWVQTTSGRPVPDALVALTPLQGFSAKFGPTDGAYAPEDSTLAPFLPASGADWTLTFWVKTDSATANGGILQLSPFPLHIRSISTAGGDKGVEVASSAMGAPYLSVVFPDSTENGWQHIALSYDGSAGQGRLYLNGVLIGLAPMTVLPSANEINLGSRTGTGGWAGCMDELRIYHRRLDELDLGEVQMGTASSLTPGLSHYWKFDEEKGLKSFDIVKRHKLYFCGASFKLDRPNVRTMGKTNQDGYYRIESANYGTGTTFLAEPMKDFYMYRALRFVRDSQSYATLPDFSVTPKATLEMWVNSAGPDGEQCLLSKQWPGNDFRLLLSPNGGSSSDIKMYLSGQEHNFGALGMGYRHLAFTMERTGSDLLVTAYQDSVLLGSHSFSGLSGEWSDPTTPWMLGARPSGGGQTDHFGGLVDELALYDTTLSAAAIAGHFKNGREMNEPGLRVYFAMDEGNGNRLNNSGSVLTPIGTAVRTTWTSFAARQKTEPHEFSPKTRQVTLNPSVTSVDQVDFVDRSTVVVSGYVRYANTDCFAEGVEILVNGASYSPKILTDSTGRFVIDFDPGVSVILTPVFEDHEFEPAARIIDRVVTPITNMLFNDITTRQLAGRVAGGSKPTCLNSITNPNGEDDCIIAIRSLDGCYEDTLEIDTKEGFFEFLNLPPLSLTVAISNHNNPAIFEFFDAAGGRVIDLSQKDSTGVNFIYTALPEVEVGGLDDYLTGCPYEVSSDETIDNLIVLPQYESVSLNIKVYEQYGPQGSMDMADRCYLDTAALTIINTFDQEYNPIEPIQDSLQGVNGATYQYDFTVDYPTPTPPHLKELQITADVDGRKGTKFVEALITGIAIGPTLFTTKSPMFPNYVLRDPPGDGSSAFLEKGTTICNTMTFEESGGVAFAISNDFKSGGDANVRIPFVGTLVKATFLTGPSEALDVWAIASNTRSMEYCITTNERIATDDSDIIVGGLTSFDGGETIYNGNDVYIGTAFNFTFSKSIEITYIRDSCLLKTKEMATVSPDSFPTTYMYSGWNLENNVIRYLQNLVDLGEDPDSTHSEAIKSWESFMLANKLAKEAALFDRNISFDAGVQYEFFTTLDTTSNQEIGVAESIEGYVQKVIKTSGSLSGVGIENEAKIGIKFKGNFLQQWGDTWSNSITTGYTLKDDDPGDNWTVDLKFDPIFKTPVFDIVAGQTSCPWEVGTANREKPVLGSSPLQILEVPSNEAAVFNLELKNESGSGETWTYNLVTFPESNPDGAVIKVNGAVLDEPLSYIVPYLGTVPVTITVERGPVAYNYEGLQIGLVSGCEYDRNQALSFDPANAGDKFYSIRTLNVSFMEPCSEVDLFNPKDGWLLKQGPADLPITIIGYDKEDDDLEGIRLQYRLTDGNGAWINIINGAPDYIPAADLGVAFTTYNWDTGDLGDGKYDVRAVTVCKGGPSDNPGFSHVISGSIDRLPPQLIGTPQPSDGVYHAGDEISFTFNQEINCSELNLNPGATLLDKILLFDASTNQPIGIDFGCYENKIVLTPTAAFQNYLFENKLIRAELHGIEDLSENVFEGTRFNKGIWEFYVDRNELAWLTDSLGMTKFEDENKTVTASIHNRGGYPVPFTLNNIPDWVHVVPNQGTLAANEILPVQFRVDSSLAFGHWNDTIIMHTEIGLNPFFMGGDEPLRFGARVVCRPPFGNVDALQFENAMNMVLRLNIQGSFSTDVEDMVAAYIDGELRGRANVQYVPQLDAYLAYLNIHGDPADMLKPVTLEIWDASDCLRYGEVQESFTYQPDNVIGNPTNPQVVHTNNLVLREVVFNNGWNWLSFNLAFPDNSLGAALSSLNHPQNDLIRSQGPFSIYSGGSWVGPLTNLSNTTMYIYRADQPDTLRMLGLPIDPLTTNIPLVAGWNWIGYIPNYSLPINEALASVPAQAGDVVKSQLAFAQYINPTFGWIGSLKYMSPPNGYQLKLSQPGTLTYPPNNPFTSNPTEERGGPESTAFWSVDPTQFEHSSTLIGMLSDEGLNATESGMELGVFVGGEVRGAAQAIYIEPLQAYLFFLTYYANTAGEQMQFKLYDGANNTVHNLTETMYFSPNQHQGSIEAPVPFQWQSTGVNTLPEGVSAFDASPNPFSSETQLRFALDKAQEVTLMITDAQGREVVRRPLSAQEGMNTSVWNGRSDTGGWLSSGVYMVRLVTDAGSVSRKVVLRRLP